MQHNYANCHIILSVDILILILTNILHKEIMRITKTYFLTYNTHLSQDLGRKIAGSILKFFSSTSLICSKGIYIFW